MGSPSLSNSPRDRRAMAALRRPLAETQALQRVREAGACRRTSAACPGLICTKLHRWTRRTLSRRIGRSAPSACEISKDLDGMAIKSVQFLSALLGNTVAAAVCRAAHVAGRYQGKAP